jgi:ABC-2 type transport system ATP-binding protein
MDKIISNDLPEFKYALEVHNLYAQAHNIWGKSKVLLLDNINFKIPKGSVCTFIGHNGAGKTTTVKSCLGLRNIESGKVIINGLDSKDILSRQRVGYIPEKGNLQKING